MTYSQTFRIFQHDSQAATAVIDACSLGAVTAEALLNRFTDDELKAKQMAQPRMFGKIHDGLHAHFGDAVTNHKNVKNFWFDNGNRQMTMEDNDFHCVSTQHEAEAKRVAADLVLSFYG
ncbi:hypothetical protein OAA10_00355 [bacterium]|nr:hypothetical protein [bacterium]